MKTRNIKKIGIVFLAALLLQGCGFKEKGLAEFSGIGGGSAAECVSQIYRNFQGIRMWC